MKYQKAREKNLKFRLLSEQFIVVQRRTDPSRKTGLPCHSYCTILESLRRERGSLTDENERLLPKIELRGCCFLFNA